MKKLTAFIIILSVIIFTYQMMDEKDLEIKNSIILPSGETMEERVNTPTGYKREEVNPLAEFLRDYSMKPHLSPVLLYNGSKKGNQDAHIAVFSLPVENENLQQCADSVMRVFAEFYWSKGEYDKIAFHFTDGFLCEYSKWRDGYRVSFENGTKWVKSASYDESYDNFKKYLRIVFSYAGTQSIESYESEEISLSELNVGDVILKGGSPGHIVMVVDVCKNQEGKKAFLLAQGYMPAQEFHIIKNPLHEDDPWYYEEEMTFPLKTFEYTFDNEKMVRRLLY